MFRLASLGIGQPYEKPTKITEDEEDSADDDAGDYYGMPPLEPRDEPGTKQIYRDNSQFDVSFDDTPPSGPTTSEEYTNEGPDDAEQAQGSDTDASSTAEPTMHESESYNQNICGMPVSQFKHHIKEHAVFTNNICYSVDVRHDSIGMGRLS